MTAPHLTCQVEGSLGSDVAVATCPRRRCKFFGVGCTSTASTLTHQSKKNSAFQARLTSLCCRWEVASNIMYYTPPATHQSSMKLPEEVAHIIHFDVLFFLFWIFFFGWFSQYWRMTLFASWWTCDSFILRHCHISTHLCIFVSHFHGNNVTATKWCHRSELKWTPSLIFHFYFVASVVHTSFFLLGSHVACAR